MNQKTNKTNLTIRITDEARQILLESSYRLGLNRSSFIELAIRSAAKNMDQDCMPFELYE